MGEGEKGILGRCRHPPGVKHKRARACALARQIARQRLFLLCKSPALIFSEVMERGMLLDQQLPDFPDLLRPKLSLREAGALRNLAQGQAALGIGLEE